MLTAFLKYSRKFSFFSYLLTNNSMYTVDTFCWQQKCSSIENCYPWSASLQGTVVTDRVKADVGQGGRHVDTVVADGHLHHFTVTAWHRTLHLFSHHKHCLACHYLAAALFQKWRKLPFNLQTQRHDFYLKVNYIFIIRKNKNKK